MRKSRFLIALLICTVTCFMAACCQETSDCPNGSFCIKGVGDCEGGGVCTDKPDACPAIYAPVCGCDGKTYDNDCEAGKAGVCIAYEGECKDVCKGNDDCEEGNYCAKSAGDCEGKGVCAEIPEVCPEIYAPVCGCDGETYANDCEAAAAGINVDYEGECSEACKGNDDCKEGNYCAKSVGDCEGKGVCAEIPEACPEIYAPVCGCDGKTYDNDCEAASAGVNIDYEGECSAGCKVNDDCDEEGYYCVKPVGDCEGEGVCAKMLMVCPDIYAPVCGCDGKTYANDCVASAAGVNIDYEGECKAFFCPRSQGYWKNHPGEWPVDELLIGGEIYSKEELIEILKTPPKGDMDLILIKQLIAAKLNKEAGADTSSIDEVIEKADDCLEMGDCSRGRLEDLKDKLDRFNNSGEDCYDNGDEDKCDCGCDDSCRDDCGCNVCVCCDRCDCDCDDVCCNVCVYCDRCDCGCDDSCCDECSCGGGCDNDCGCNDGCNDACGCDEKCCND